jgi:hypothetical protein
MSKDISYIIKAQIEYSLNKIHHTLILFVGIFTYAYLKEFNPLNLFCFLLFVQYASIAVLKNPKENRYYTLRLLGVAAKRIALSRILIIMLGFIIIYTFAVLVHNFFLDIQYGFRDSINELFMFGGVALCGIFFYMMISDVFSVFKYKSGFILFNVAMGILIGLLAFAVIIAIFESYQTSSYLSQVFVVILYIVSISLAAISYFTYQYRKSHAGYY